MEGYWGLTPAEWVVGWVVTPKKEDCASGACGVTKAAVLAVTIWK